MFDTVLGLPVHALVVHGAVVLLPLMALVTIVVALVPRLPFLAWLMPQLRVLTWLVVIADAGMVVLAFLARQSGEALQARLGGSQVAADHAAFGRNVIWFAMGLFLASVLVAMARGSRRMLPAAIVAVVAGTLVVISAVLTGHSGSQAVWGPIVQSTNK